MRRVGYYAGSFNPWHKGHDDILNKALHIFDKVVVLVADNSMKEEQNKERYADIASKVITTNVEVEQLPNGTLLVDYLKTKEECHGLIRGLRNSNDFEYEKTMQYWSEDLGLDIPIVYLISDRTLCHISSSGYRAIERIKK